MEIVARLVTGLAFLLTTASFVSCENTTAEAQEIRVKNGGRWGHWGALEHCPNDNAKVVGFTIQLEPNQGPIIDDTALNGVFLLCEPSSTWISSDVGPWGDIGGVHRCLDGAFLTEFKLRVEKPQGRGDDTAANDIIFKCSDGLTLGGDGGRWGGWGEWSGRCDQGICGIRSRVEKPLGRRGDDTALNDVRFSCC